MSFNINNISYDDFKDICRMCMLNCDVKFSRNSVISTIFLKLTDFHFETNDDLPKQICRNCFEKINEIHEFALKCKQTQSALLECLNNQKNVNLNESIESKHEIPIIIDKNVIIDQFKSEYVEDISLNLTDKVDYKLNDETSEINEHVIENTDLQETSYNIEEEIKIEEHKIEFIKVEHVFDEESEINNDQNVNYSEDDLMISNTANINIENKNVFKQHQSSLDCKPPFKCDQCSKLFTSSFNLKTHLRTHSGERPFKCEQCSKSFIQLVHLKNHVRLHSGERPFKCDLCTKSFANNSNLYKHRRTHTGERPFKCDQCSQSFNDTSSLARHKLMHSGERPFKCVECFKSFNHFGNMKRHMRMHSGERPSKQS